MSSLYELTQLPLPQRILRKQNALPMEWRGRLLDKGGSVINPSRTSIACCNASRSSRPGIN